MRKMKIAMFVVIMVVSFSLASLANGLENELKANMPFNVEGLEIIGNVTYNTIEMSGVINGDDVWEAETWVLSEKEKGLKSGLGYNIQVNYWISNWFGVNAALDGFRHSATIEDDSSDLVLVESGKLNGFAFGITTKHFNDIFRTNLSYANYDYSLGFEFKGTDFKISEPYKGGGLLLGGGLNIPVHENITVAASADLRVAMVAPTAEPETGQDRITLINLSGMRYSLGVGYSF